MEWVAAAADDIRLRSGANQGHIEAVEEVPVPLAVVVRELVAHPENLLPHRARQRGAVLGSRPWVRRRFFKKATKKRLKHVILYFWPLDSGFGYV